MGVDQADEPGMQEGPCLINISSLRNRPINLTGRISKLVRVYAPMVAHANGFQNIQGIDFHRGGGEHQIKNIAGFIRNEAGRR
jgi:hypothetical protein